MRYLTVKNWSEFQHYKDRNPPWIKLHRSVIDDYEFASLPDHAKGQLMLIWIFASQNEGRIPQDAKFLERKLGFTQKVDLDELVQRGFLIAEQDASNVLAERKRSDSEPLADCKHDASPRALARGETEKRRGREETDSARGFERFWSAYPRHTAKAVALKAWIRLDPDESLQDRIVASVAEQSRSPQWLKDGGQFIPHPATWLNQRRWEDAASPPPAVDRSRDRTPEEMGL